MNTSGSAIRLLAFLQTNPSLSTRSVGMILARRFNAGSLQTAPRVASATAEWRRNSSVATRREGEAKPSPGFEKPG